MNSQINLISKQESLDIKKKKKAVLIRTISFVLLGIVGFFALVLIFLYSQLKISSIEESQATLLKEMMPLREKSAKLIEINNRAKVIQDIIKERVNFQESLGEISDQLPPTMIVDKIGMTKDELNMTLSTTSLYDLKIFIDRMISLASSKKIIQDLTLQNFTFSPKSGKYNLRIGSNLL